MIAATAAGLAALTTAAAGGQAPPDQPQVLARAIGGPPSGAIVAFVAENAQTTRYDEQRRPKLKTMTLNAGIEAHCGSVQSGYLDALRLANPGLTLAEGAPLGDTAYTITWPACLHADPSTVEKYVIGQDDTPSGIRQKFTGAGAFNPSALRKFFVRSGVSWSKALPVGKTITISETTSRTLLIPRTMSPTTFATRLQELAGSTTFATADIESPGSIIGPVKFATATDTIGSVQGTFAPCAGADGNSSYPFNPAAVSAAYAFTRDQIIGSVSRVTVVVVDNGFFGVPCDGPKCPKIIDDRLAESPRFPRQYFDTIQFDSRAGLGPVLSGTKINPLNYWNAKPNGQSFQAADVNAESGHGTHVAGLVLGGPAFNDRRAHFLGADQKAWLRLVIANLARGQRTLATGTDRELVDMLRQIDGAKIVNMSIAFHAQPGTTIGDTIKDAIVKDGQSLFVVAAGNDGGNLNDDQLDLYPASLGGAENNVLTVSSVDNDVAGVARLSNFSNRSANHVDLAAPGCRLMSWLDGDAPPAEISGTSQATPVVSFAAALLSSVWPTSPMKIKNRLLYSGDLLDDKGDRDQVRSRSKLSIAKALTYTMDRVTFERGGVRRTLLGNLDLVQNLKCADTAAIDGANLRAIKRGPDNEVSFYRVRNDGSLKICPGTFSGATLSFSPLREIRDGQVSLPATLDSPITADETIEIVRKL